MYLRDIILDDCSPVLYIQIHPDGKTQSLLGLSGYQIQQFRGIVEHQLTVVLCLQSAMLPPADVGGPLAVEDLEPDTDSNDASGHRSNVWAIIGGCAAVLIAVCALICATAYAWRRRKRAAEERRTDLASVQVQPLHDYLRRKKEEADSHEVRTMSGHSRCSYGADTLKTIRTILNCSLYWNVIAHLWCASSPLQLGTPR